MTNAQSPTRRELLQMAGAAAAIVTLPAAAAARVRALAGNLRIGMITDLHQDIMHDGEARMDAFVTEMKARKADCIMQLGDFAYPNPKNKSVIDKFNAGNKHALHVIGNHDMDSGHTRKQCVEVWGMSAQHYIHDVGGLRILVLDGNDKGSPTHKGGYAAYVGKEQQAWLTQQLESHDGPFLIACHQSFAGPWAVDNALEMQALLTRFADRIAICINGHNHIDMLKRTGGVNYLHVNSASYQWVGGTKKHESYSTEIHKAHPWIEYTCPYRDSVFSALVFDSETGTITVEGQESTWVGPSPAALGVDLDPTLTNGEEIAPRTRARRIEKIRR